MSINRSFLTEQLLLHAEDVSPYCQLEAIFEFCRDNNPQRWCHVFHPNSLERNMVIDNYFKHGGTVILPQGMPNRDQELQRLNMLFSFGTESSKVMLGIIQKLAEKLYPDENKVLCPKCTKSLDLLCHRDPRWKGQFSDTVLEPKVYSSNDLSSIELIKRSCTYLREALKDSGDLFSTEIVTALDILQNSLLQFVN